MIGECYNQTFKNCMDRKSIGHHLYHPKRDYVTDLEIAFRNLPENIIQICKCAERLIHESRVPPIKPTVEAMCLALTVTFAADQP